MRTTVLVAGGVALLAACSGSGAVSELADQLPDDVTPTTEAEAPTPVTDDEVDILAIETVWAQNNSEICPLYREALATGIDPDALADYAVAKFTEGYGHALSPTVEARLLELIDEC